MQLDFTAVLIIPTGIGAEVGGYAGDALPIARCLAGAVDCLITHPNVLNGANLYWSLPNTLYVEGYALDRFLAGEWNLQPVHSNSIGVILDCDIPDDLKLRHRQVIGAVRATLGLRVLDPLLTEVGLGVELRLAESGVSWGTIAQVDELRRCGAKLKQAGATAIAVVAWFPNHFYGEYSAQVEKYRQGQGVDILAGVEAVISHLLTRELMIPCAHAPALQPLPLNPAVDDRACAEELGFTFLPCVLVGLSRAPQIVTQGGIDRSQVKAVIVPESACGGSGLLAIAHQPHVQIIAVKNLTVLSVYPEQVGIKPEQVIRVNNYAEAIGVITALKTGVGWRSLYPAAHSPPPPPHR
ncbi:MAG: DUF3326 domain-containing protein [Pseudanabaenaceae cyanobacterium]